MNKFYICLKDLVLNWFAPWIQERVLRCHQVIQEMTLMKNRTYSDNNSPSVSTVTKSPIGVLDAGVASYESDDTTAGSHADCHHSSPATKRRKLNRPSTS